MARTISTGTPTTTAHTGSWPIATVPYTTDYSVKDKTSGETIWTNTKSPLDRPETVRQAYSVVKDIYKGTDIASGVRAASSKGVSLLTQVTQTWEVTDSADATVRVQLPVSAHLVIKMPASGDVTSTMVEALLQKMIGSLYNESSALSTAKLDALLRGSIS